MSLLSRKKRVKSVVTFGFEKWAFGQKKWAKCNL